MAAHTPVAVLFPTPCSYNAQRLLRVTMGDTMIPEENTGGIRFCTEIAVAYQQGTQV